MLDYFSGSRSGHVHENFFRINDSNAVQIFWVIRYERCISNILKQRGVIIDEVRILMLSFLFF